MLEKVLYVCNPKKAITCKKTTCKSNKQAAYPVCDRTSIVEYAARDEKGMPIIAKEQPKQTVQ